MKAFLLAGGLGERLRPLTLDMPKCLVPINGKPLLALWLEHCARHGITDVLLNVSQHPSKVRSFLETKAGTPRVTLVVEAQPRGSANTVRDHRAFVEGEESFWVFYADNLTDVALDGFAATHAQHDGVMTMGLFHAPDPRAAGIVQVDAAGRIVAFEEKPVNPRGDLANAGIYLARRAVLERLPVGLPLADFGHDVLPKLVGDMYGHVIEQFIMDIGTPDALNAASAAWARRRPTGARS